VVFNLNKGLPAIVLLSFCVLPILMATLLPTARATLTSKPSDVNVDHVVEIRDGGLLVINDTVKLLTKPGESIEIRNYTIGFPYVYKLNLDYVFAYETADPSSRLNVELDAGMGVIGFYGVNVFLSSPISLMDGESYEFTVVSVFSDSIRQTASVYNATFPAYPSLLQTASKANVTIVFPVGLNYTRSSFENEGASFTLAVSDPIQYFNYVKSDLTGFSSKQAWFEIGKASNALQLIDVNEVNREIDLPGLDHVDVSESYRAVGTGEPLAKIDLKLPKAAFAVSAYDEFGPLSSDKVETEEENGHTKASITFAVPYDQGREALFAVHYKLPWSDCVNAVGWSDFNFSLTLFEDIDWTIRRLTTTINLPEGASLLSTSLPAGLYGVQKTAFKSALTFVYQNATPFHNLSLNFMYNRPVFWESFRPTLWMGFFVAIAGAVVGAWRFVQPMAAPVPTAIISILPEELRKFVDLYDEKRRLRREIESLEVQARKGKIPRRRYKVRKMTIESRLSVLSRDSKALEEKIRIAGPRYTDLMHQLEVAETELEGVEADINRTEVRYRRGEISPTAYNKLLEDVYRRRDRARTTIDGVLLRLKEEIV